MKWASHAPTANAAFHLYGSAIDAKDGLSDSRILVFMLIVSEDMEEVDAAKADEAVDLGSTAEAAATLDVEIQLAQIETRLTQLATEIRDKEAERQKNRALLMDAIRNKQPASPYAKYVEYTHHAEELNIKLKAVYIALKARHMTDREVMCKSAAKENVTADETDAVTVIEAELAEIDARLAVLATEIVLSASV
ncbi:hypothetical protein HDU81_004766 [Chytriomyces hyalinus]|nr:hypothetical protein HDU81_004766 [Chytriomyces hyalinus]